MKIAVVIPAYNEEQTIQEVMRSFHREIPDAEIVVVDNNSSDATGDKAAAAFAEGPIPGRLLDCGRKGKANAVRTGLSAMNADVCVLVDADSTYHAEDVHALIRPIAEGAADMVVGDRLSGGDYFRENTRNFHGFGNKLVRRIINFIFRSRLNDIMTGYRAFSRSFVENYPILVEGFELETDMTLHALDKKFRIREVPVRYTDRPRGSTSKLNTFRDGAHVLATIFNIFKNYRPFAFFGLWSALFFLLSLAAGAPVIAEFIRTNYVAHIPLAILSTGLMIVSLLSFSIGLILDTVVRNHRFEYELKLLQSKRASHD